MSDIVQTGSTGTDVVAPGSVMTDLQRFESVVRAQLAEVGFPSGEVFVDVSERHTMLANVPQVLARLDDITLGRSFHISKMIAAAAVGLFDAALNYLWDELVNELRRRVAGFDLKYFYDIAAGSGDLRKRVKDESDLSKVEVLASRSANNPVTNPAADRRGSTRPNRCAKAPSTWSRTRCHPTASTL